MTQVQIAKVLGVQQPQVSLLMRNRAGNFSVGRLMEFLTALRRDVEITVRPGTWHTFSCLGVMAGQTMLRITNPPSIEPAEENPRDMRKKNEVGPARSAVLVCTAQKL